MKRALTIVCGSKVFIVKCSGAGAVRVNERPANTPATAAMTMSAAPIASGCTRRGLTAGATVAPDPAVAVPESASSANATSRADWNRSTGFFSRQCRMMRSIAGDMAARVPVISGGSSLRTAVIVSAAVSR